MKMKILAATAAMLMTTTANAAVITFTTPISVPNTTSGVYVNLVTGLSGTSPATGWDFNPWGSTANGLVFFWPSTPANSSGGVASATTGPFLDLAAGSVVSSASIFSTASGAASSAAFKTTGTHIIGVRFFNEATSAINYGYVTMSTTGTTGFPATILGWSYENTGAAITVGGAAAAVPEPATWGLMIAGFGMVGFSLRRRSSVKTTVSFA